MQVLTATAFFSFSFPRGSTVLRNPGRVFSTFLNPVLDFLEGGRGGGGSPVARTLPTQDSTTQKGEDEHPCLERVSNGDISDQAVKTDSRNCAANVIGFSLAFKYLRK
jgi:hypothetical protein